MAEYIDESLPEDLKKVIHTARILMFSDDGFMQQALSGSESLEESAARMLYLVIKLVEQQMGPEAELDDEELFQVITHLAGSIAEFAQASGDPDAEDLASAVENIRGRTMELFGEEPDEQEQPTEGMEQPQMPQQPPMPPDQQPLMGGVMQ